MINGSRSADVYVRKIYAGTVRETDAGYSFLYDSDYLSRSDALPVSITLPLTDRAFTSSVLFPFFDGLIPEGWLLDAACRNWKLNRNDRFGLLMVCCRDCIGDVSIREACHEM